MPAAFICLVGIFIGFVVSCFARRFLKNLEERQQKLAKARKPKSKK